MKHQANKGERIAKIIARAGLASRRESEKLILDGRVKVNGKTCLLYTSPSPRDKRQSRMPSSA